MIGVAADVSTRRAARRSPPRCGALGRLDWLVNNAGTGGGTAGLDVDVERARRVLETNFYAHVALTHELWPLLRESPRARVIVVSSSLGTYSSSGSITYGASKAALTSWGRALAVAARRDGHRGHARQSRPRRDDDLPARRAAAAPLEGQARDRRRALRRRHHAQGRSRRRRALVAPALPGAGGAAGDRARHVRPLLRLTGRRSPGAERSPAADRGDHVDARVRRRAPSRARRAPGRRRR